MSKWLSGNRLRMNGSAGFLTDFNYNEVSNKVEYFEKFKWDWKTLKYIQNVTKMWNILI